jgi:hypothetical protein
MKSTALIIIFICISLICWIFATSTLVDGSHNKTAFKIKSFFYWLAIVASISIGYLISNI